MTDNRYALLHRLMSDYGGMTIDRIMDTPIVDLAGLILAGNRAAKQNG